jgi:hypothetical protein
MIKCLMTTDDFRRMELAMPGAEELNGMGYPNFRAGRRSFAAIEDAVDLVSRLTRDQQATFVGSAPEMFAPATDGWGKWGSTIGRLEAADEATLWDALATAWRNVTGVSIDPFKVGDADNVNDAVDDLAGNAKTTDIDAADVPDAAADVPHVIGADVANGPGINVADVHDASVADVVDLAHVDTADVPDVGNRGADPANGPDGRTDVANIPSVNTADAAKAEPPDDLQKMIERLQAYWGSGPAT